MTIGHDHLTNRDPHMVHQVDLVTVTHMPTSTLQLLINQNASLRFRSKSVTDHSPNLRHPHP